MGQAKMEDKVTTERGNDNDKHPELIVMRAGMLGD